MELILTNKSEISFRQWALKTFFLLRVHAIFCQHNERYSKYAELRTHDARFRVRRRVINYAREIPGPSATGTKYPFLYVDACNLDYTVPFFE